MWCISSMLKQERQIEREQARARASAYTSEPQGRCRRLWFLCVYRKDITIELDS